jgi:hypothetical protein
VLDALGEPGAEMALRERRERVEVDDDLGGLVEHADGVLLELHPRLDVGRGVGVGDVEIDGGLPAHRRVDHGEEGGRALDDGCAAFVGGGDETGEIAHDPTAQGEDGLAPVQPVNGAVGEKSLGGGEGLGLLAGADGEDGARDAGPPEKPGEKIGAGEQRVVGDDHGAGCTPARPEAGRELGEEP